MDTAAIRQKLHSYLEVVDDKKIKAIYEVMEADIEEKSIEYTNELKAELDKRYADYKNGKAKIITREESKKRLQKILKSGTKK